MTCDSCAKDISDALHKLPGIIKVEANVREQLVSIEGTGSSDRCCHICSPSYVYWTDVETGQWHHRPSSRPSKPPGGTPSYEGPGPQTVSAAIDVLLALHRLNCTANADPEIFPRPTLIRFVSFSRA